MPVNAIDRVTDCMLKALRKYGDAMDAMAIINSRARNTPLVLASLRRFASRTTAEAAEVVPFAPAFIGAFVAAFSGWPPPCRS
jgi:hypothetical protein